MPGSFKPLIHSQEQVSEMRKNLWSAIEHVEKVSVRTGKILHLGLEPEPLCYLETSQETLKFFQDMCADRPRDERVSEFLGVNYDCCHLAVEYEQPEAAIKRLTENGIRISKLHFSNALKVVPTEKSRAALKPFLDSVYFHQVIARNAMAAIPDIPICRMRWSVMVQAGWKRKKNGEFIFMFRCIAGLRSSLTQPAIT